MQRDGFRPWVLNMKYLSDCVSKDFRELSVNLRPYSTESIRIFLTTRDSFGQKGETMMETDVIPLNKAVITYNKLDYEAGEQLGWS